MPYIDTKSVINTLADSLHSTSVDAGFYDNPVEDGTAIALMHSELSEALEGYRKHKMDDHLPHRTAAEVELADAVIRILEHASYKGYDIGGAILEKNEYNKTRHDHKRETRALAGGKSF